MAIVHSYVKLPEGNICSFENSSRIQPCPAKPSESVTVAMDPVAKTAQVLGETRVDACYGRISIAPRKPYQPSGDVKTAMP